MAQWPQFAIKVYINKERCLSTKSSSLVSPMPTKHVPPEIWIQIFRFATLIPTHYTSQRAPLSSSFDLCRQEDIRNFESDYTRSLVIKSSISMTCKSWRYLVFPFLWEVLCVLPGRKHHTIGSSLQQYHSNATDPTKIDEIRAGDCVQALHILEPEDAAVHELYDMANIQRILICCPNIAIFTAPEEWQLFRRDSHLSFRSNGNLREVHLSAIDEESIQSIFQFPDQLLVVHGSNFELWEGRNRPEIILPNVHTISMRLSDMEDRNIFAPSLSRWVLHDNIIGINETTVYQKHATLVTSLELASWCDRAAIQTALSGMPQLQELAIHLDSLCLSPIPCHLPRTLRRLGFFCSYSKQGWVLDTDAGTFRWFLEHLDDWFAVAKRTHETLDLVRFLDWEEVKLPRVTLARRRASYLTWWSEQLVSCEGLGVRVENQYGSLLTIETAASTLDL